MRGQVSGRRRRLTVTILAISATIAVVPPATTAFAATPTTLTTTTRGARSTRLRTAGQWVLAAVAAEEKVGSVRVDGKVTQGKSQILLDLLVNGDGEGGGALVERGNLVKVERVGALLYLNAPRRFWASHATARQTNLYGGKWIALDASDQHFASIDRFLDPTSLAVAAFQGHTTPLTLGKPAWFAGHKVVVVKGESTANGKTTTETMYIGTASPHDVYKIVDRTPTEVGTIVFGHYGRAVPLTVPPEPLDLTTPG